MAGARYAASGLGDDHFDIDRDGDGKPARSITPRLPRSRI
jgi:hypothetical protein